MTDNRKIIILVDDDPLILKMARNILMNDYDVFTVPNGEKLFLLLEKIFPNLILLDVMMPEMSGYEILNRLKSDARTESIPIIFITSRTDPENELEGLNLGAVDYIAKPLSPQLLLKRVNIHIQLESQKRELRLWNENLQKIVMEKTGIVMHLQNAVLKTVSNLVECRDDVTGEHVERTEQVLRLLVENMLCKGVYSSTLQTWDIELFYQSALLHDVGKIAIRDSILLKPGKLTQEEFEEMKGHTLFGEKIIEKIQQDAEESMFLTHAKIMAGTHHEKWDGTGYPRGLSGSSIPLQGRLMAVADVYDALISERPYKKPMTREQASRILEEESGRHFDPIIVNTFLDVCHHLDNSSAT
jgi:putative two-component system response regulator